MVGHIKRRSAVPGLKIGLISKNVLRVIHGQGANQLRRHGRDFADHPFRKKKGEQCRDNRNEKKCKLHILDYTFSFPCVGKFERATFQYHNRVIIQKRKDKNRSSQEKFPSSMDSRPWNPFWLAPELQTPSLSLYFLGTGRTCQGYEAGNSLSIHGFTFTDFRGVGLNSTQVCRLNQTIFKKLFPFY